MIAHWPCPLPGGAIAEEYAFSFDRSRTHRLLVVPALLDEGNRMRRLMGDVMRRLDGSGIDSLLIDLPGTNESLQPLERQTLDGWRLAVAAAARHFRATHVLGVRAGALLTPAGLPTWHYAPVDGATVLRQLIRARIIAAREAGREETRERLIEQACNQGIELAGYRLGAEWISAMLDARVDATPAITAIPQDLVGGSGLWLRAEPDEDPHQADALAAVLAIGMTA